MHLSFFISLTRYRTFFVLLHTIVGESTYFKFSIVRFKIPYSMFIWLAFVDHKVHNSIQFAMMRVYGSQWPRYLHKTLKYIHYKYASTLGVGRLEWGQCWSPSDGAASLCFVRSLRTILATPGDDWPVRSEREATKKRYSIHTNVAAANSTDSFPYLCLGFFVWAFEAITRHAVVP